MGWPIGHPATSGDGMPDAVRDLSTVFFNGASRVLQRTNISIAASQTDSAIVAAQGAGLKIYVMGFQNNAGATASTFVFTTKPGGAGTAISPVYTPANNAIYGIQAQAVVLCATNANEGLSATTGAGSTTVGTVWWFVAP